MQSQNVKMLLQLSSSICLLVFLIYGCSASEEASLIKVGDKLPDFSISTIAASDITPSSVKDKVFVLNFFATWCGPCMEEMPYLEKEIWRKFSSNKQFLMVSIGRGHSVEEIKRFQAEHVYTLPLAADPDRSVYNLFADTYIPRTYIVNTEGIVVYAHIGFRKSEIDKMQKIISQEI